MSKCVNCNLDTVYGINTPLGDVCEHCINLVKIDGEYLIVPEFAPWVALTGEHLSLNAPDLNRNLLKKYNISYVKRDIIKSVKEAELTLSNTYV